MKSKTTIALAVVCVALALMLLGDLTEPASLLLLGAGLSGLSIYRRRRAA
ncbi:MAG TPA: PEP-CTERM sorting domain-containing protein [Vicinamibacterales bacterium]|nr:PEP-CTERM sorting domain-containing protein [Vicinamibacterales bacterium]